MAFETYRQTFHYIRESACPARRRQDPQPQCPDPLGSRTRRHTSHTTAGVGMDLGLRGKHAIVTGKSGHRKPLRGAGSRRVDVDRGPHEAQLEATARELAARPAAHHSAAADVTSKEQVDEMVAEASGSWRAAHPVNSGSPGARPRPPAHRDHRRRGLLHDFNVKYVGRCAAPARHPPPEGAEVGRIINISGTNARNAGNLSGGAATRLWCTSQDLAVQLAASGSRSTASTRASAHRAHPGLLAARPPSCASPRRSQRRDYADDSPGATPSAAWWTRRRSPTCGLPGLGQSWPSPASSSWPRGAARRSITEGQDRPALRRRAQLVKP